MRSILAANGLYGCYGLVARHCCSGHPPVGGAPPLATSVVARPRRRMARHQDGGLVADWWHATYEKVARHITQVWRTGECSRVIAWGVEQVLPTQRDLVSQEEVQKGQWKTSSVLWCVIPIGLKEALRSYRIN